MPTYPGPIDSKLPRVGTTIFTVMSRLAAEHNAINLSQGFPDFDCAPELRALVTKYINAGLNQYPPMAGVAPLREAIAAKIEALYKIQYDVEQEITVVPGATYGIYTAVAAMIRPGDEVILFEPTYDSYAPAVEVHGGVPVYVQLRYPDYSIDWQAVQNAITPRTKLLIINTPNNPTATVMSAEDMRMLEGLLHGTDITVISDEVYEHIVFDGYEHQSVTRFPGLAERSFLVSSFGKTYWLENGLRRRAARTDGGIPQGAPVQRLRRQWSVSVCLCRIHEKSRGLSAPRGVLPEEAGFFPGRPQGLTLQAAALARYVFPESRLRRDQR
jgi:methionine aminotransferase